MLFESRENRSAIWNELKKINYFDGFKASSKDEVRRLLDNAITMIAIQKPQLPVHEKNNEVIQQMLSNRDLFISSERDTSLSIQSNVGGITAEGMREIREQEFTRQLSRHQAEFDSIINQGRPENIDFSDKNQEPKIGGEMESLVAKVQRMRQMDLESATKMAANQRPHDVEKWINGGRTLRIEQDSNLPVEAVPITPRKVRFSETNKDDKVENKNEFKTMTTDTDDIFLRLKTKQLSQEPVQETKGIPANSITNLEKRLDNLEKKLETIIDSLHVITNSLSSLSSLSSQNKDTQQEEFMNMVSEHEDLP